MATTTGGKERKRRNDGGERRNLLTGIKHVPRVEEEEDDDDDDYWEEEDGEITMFRQGWVRQHAGRFVSFEDLTFPPMRYTFGRIPPRAGCDNGFQLFSIKLSRLLTPPEEEEGGGLQWPLHIYGLVALRDWLDHKRNLVFNRTRDDCQILTQRDPFLLLTGPTRAVSLLDPVFFEIQLKAKTTTTTSPQHQDKFLNFSVFNSGYANSYAYRDSIITSSLRKRSELEFTFAILSRSLEATIAVELVDGSWPHHFRPKFVARTASIPHLDIVLLDSPRPLLCHAHGGVIHLSRRVVSVELSGQLIVDVMAYNSLQVSHQLVDDDDNNYSSNNSVVAQCQAVFAPKEASVSAETCHLGGFCKLKISVAWSLLDTEPDYYIYT